MSEIRVIRMRTYPDAEPTPSGRRYIARFDIEVAGIRIHRCHLVRNRHDGLDVYPPRMDPDIQPGGLHSVLFVKGARRAIRDAARREYELAMIERAA